MPTRIKKVPKVFLSYAHLSGFKSIEDLKIDFQAGLNVLIGKNGAGKSNFMEALHQAIRFRANSKTQLRYSKLGFISEDNHVFQIETERESHPKLNKENLTDQLDVLERFYIDDKLVFDSTEETESKRKFEFKNKSISYRSIPRGLFLILGYQHIYPLYLKYNLPENLAGIDLPATIRANFEHNGYYWIFPDTINFMDGVFWNLEQFFDNDAGERKETTAADIFKQLTLPNDILHNLKSYTPIEDVKFNSNINLYNEDKSLIVENVKLDFKVNGSWMPWSQLSDGTKRLFYIVAEVTYSDGLVLIEEPELGIHPHQFNLLMNFLKDESEEKQIIISTHSPKALDHLTPDELNSILIAVYDLNEGTQIRHLTEKEMIKGQKYMKEVGFFSDYWMLSDIEEW